MAASDNDDRSGGMLNGQGVGVVIVAIFVGVALLVIYAASDGVLFAQPPSPLPADAGQQQDVVTPEPGTSSVATVISRDAFDKEPDNATASRSSPPPNSDNVSDAQQKLLAIKNFQWNSVSEKYVKDNQERLDNLTQHSEQKQQSASEKEPLVLPGNILVNTSHKEKANDTATIDDQSILEGATDNADTLPTKDNESSQNQNDSKNDESAAEGNTTDNSVNEGSSSESDQIPPSNSTGSSSSNSTQSSTTNPESENSNSTGIQIEVSLG